MNRTRKTVTFDTRLAIPAAWKLCWEDNIKKRAAGDDYRGNTYYLTAADIVYQVRSFAAETLRGETWGATGRAWGGVCLSPVRLSGDVQSAVRRWLQNEVLGGRLESHNFGKGHISGMRFRPKGEALSPAEQSTTKHKVATKDRPRLWHYKKGSGLLCVARGPYSCKPSPSMRTLNRNQVTCPRCKKLLAEEVKL